MPTSKSIRPISTFLLPLFGLTTGLLLLLIVYSQGIGFFTNNSSDPEKLANGMTGMASKTFEAMLNGHESLARTLALVLSDPRIKMTDVRHLTQALVKTCPEVYGAVAGFEPYALDPKTKYQAEYFFSRPGEIGHFDLASVENPYVNWPWYTLGKVAQQPAWTPPYVDEGSEGHRLVTCVVRMARDSVRIGVLALDLSLTRLQGVISDLDLPNGGSALLLTRDGTVLAHTDTSLILQAPFARGGDQRKDAQLVGIVERMEVCESGSFKVEATALEGEKLVSFISLESAEWYMVVILPQTDGTWAWRAVLFCVAAGLVMVVLSLYELWSRRGAALHVGTQHDALQ